MKKILTMLMTMALIAVLAFGLVGCGENGNGDVNPIVGVWRATYSDIEGTITFNADGTGIDNGTDFSFQMENDRTNFYWETEGDILRIWTDDEVVGDDVFGIREIGYGIEGDTLTIIFFAVEGYDGIEIFTRQ